MRVSESTQHRIESSGSRNSPNRVSADGRNGFTFSSISCCPSAAKRGKHSWLRVGSIQRNRCLQSIPSLGSIRAAILMAVIQTPHRFRTKRQLWAYSGLALETHSSGDYRLVAGQLRPSKKPATTGGLNTNHNHDLKYVFMSAAISSSVCPGPFREFYAGLLAKGARPSMARVTLARKIAAVTLILWKKGEQFEADKLKLQAA